MPRPNLPKYTDPENSHFHPVFKAAAEGAIQAKGLSKTILVKSQYPSPTGPIDLVLFNDITKKVILPVEIKRSQSNVRGGGRRQARDYWVNLGLGCESLFYCVSNLELVELFRSDPAKPRTSAQKLIIKNPITGDLENTQKDVFYNCLQSTIEEIIDTVKGDIPFTYSAGLTQFQTNLEASVCRPDEWHQLFIPVCFEYIRGAATQIAALKNQTSSWKSASLYQNNPERLASLGGAVDFSHVFRAPATISNDPIAFAKEVIKEAFEAGKYLGRGDDIAELVNEILQKPSAPGIVETDIELAQLLAVIARVSLGRELESNEIAFDPASGSGRLLTALPQTAFPSIGPSQIKANEKEILFSEPLSLRLGLSFGSVLSINNAPKITISSIESIGQNFLSAVKLVVMNPPYLSGVQAAGIKESFTKRIKEISGNDSLLDIGQVALEILFLELIWHLVPVGTVIATVFPTQHLTRLSEEVVEFRKFLCQKFILSHIAIYPRQSLFENVIKQTVLLVGKKETTISDQNIKVVEVQTNVGDLDLNELMLQLQAESLQPTYGVEVKQILRSELLTSSDKGWKKVLGAGVKANSFIQKYMNTYSIIGSLRRKHVRRGSLGNNGNTALTVFSKTNPKHPSVVALIPIAWICPALNTTENMPRELTTSNAPELSFLPPPSAYINNSADNLILRDIINEYLLVQQSNTGSQVKATKTPNTIENNLKSNQKDCGAGWVLIQRASRKKGEVCLLEESGILLSTNVPMIALPTLRERKLFASWMLSVFGQIQLELASSDQEGMRKLELKSIKCVYFPDFSSIPKHIELELIKQLSTELAHEFEALEQRSSDSLWAEIVAPNSSSLCLTQAFAIFQEMVDERRGFG